LGDAKAMRDLVASIKGNISIGQIMAMKSASESGGALGQIPIGQMEIMMGLLGNVSANQRREIVIDNLKRVQNIYSDLVHGRPDQIQARIGKRPLNEDGTEKISPYTNEPYAILTPERAAVISERQILSFDDRGNPMIPAALEQWVDPVTGRRGITEEDIKETMSSNRLERWEVIDRLLQTLERR
jgi:hypothetical protein